MVTMPASVYPDGYRDPPWDGTAEGFRDVVIPARIAAMTEMLSRALPDGMRFEWVEPDGSPTP